MTIWVHRNRFFDRVVSDLMRIGGAGTVAVDPETGILSFSATVSDPGAAILGGLTFVPQVVFVRGEDSGFGLGAVSLHEAGGEVLYDRYPDTTSVEIAYDVTRCEGSGSWVLDLAGDPIDMPSDVALFHELAHAAELFVGRYDPMHPEDGAIAGENRYRESRGLPKRSGHAGGCGGAPPAAGTGSGAGSPGGTTTDTTTETTTSTPCSLSVAVSGAPSTLRPFRSFRDKVLRPAPVGRAFIDDYYGSNGGLATLLARRPAFRRVTGAWVRLGASHLRLLERLADVDMGTLDRAWATTVSELTRMPDAWKEGAGGWPTPAPAEAGAPQDFGALPAPARGLLVRLLAGHPAIGAWVVEHLRLLRSLPSHDPPLGSGISSRDLRILRRHGAIAQRLAIRPPDLPLPEIPASGSSSRRPRLAAFGTDHVGPMTRADEGTRPYLVTVTNGTADVIDLVTVAYKHRDHPLVIPLFWEPANPGQSVIFVLSECATMESYALGIIPDLSAPEDSPGYFQRLVSRSETPVLDDEDTVGSLWRCADEWEIVG